MSIIDQFPNGMVFQNKYGIPSHMHSKKNFNIYTFPYIWICNTVNTDNILYHQIVIRFSNSRVDVRFPRSFSIGDSFQLFPSLALK